VIKVAQGRVRWRALIFAMLTEPSGFVGYFSSVTNTCVTLLRRSSSAVLQDVKRLLLKASLKILQTIFPRYVAADEQILT
jgi:hypothetical protein